MKLRAAVLAIFGLVLAGCDLAAQHEFNRRNSVAGKPIPPGATVDWTLMQTSVLNTCADCHGTRARPKLTSYSDMVANIDKIWGDVRDHSMPPAKAGYGALSDCQQAALQKWMDLKEPQTSEVQVSTLPQCASNGGGGEIPISQLPLNYTTLVKRILQPKCMRCHNPNDDTDAAGVLFDPYGVIAKDLRWAPPAKDSKVLAMLTRTDKDRMPPPETGGPLSAEEIDYISRWIDAGRPQ